MGFHPDQIYFLVFNSFLLQIDDICIFIKLKKKILICYIGLVKKEPKNENPSDIHQPKQINRQRSHSPAGTKCVKDLSFIYSIAINDFKYGFKILHKCFSTGVPRHTSVS
jgi:hypothetical protein